MSLGIGSSYREPDWYTPALNYREERHEYAPGCLCDGCAEVEAARFLGEEATAIVFDEAAALPADSLPAVAVHAAFWWPQLPPGNGPGEYPRGDNCHACVALAGKKNCWRHR